MDKKIKLKYKPLIQFSSIELFKLHPTVFNRCVEFILTDTELIVSEFLLHRYKNI